MLRGLGQRSEAASPLLEFLEIPRAHLRDETSAMHALGTSRRFQMLSHMARTNLMVQLASVQRLSRQWSPEQCAAFAGGREASGSTEHPANALSELLATAGVLVQEERHHPDVLERIRQYLEGTPLSEWLSSDAPRREPISNVVGLVDLWLASTPPGGGASREVCGAFVAFIRRSRSRRLRPADRDLDRVGRTRFDQSAESLTAE